ncbi:MAG: hypothetical protein ACRENO_02140 [Thermodesulfobacteriota bacterium]
MKTIFLEPINDYGNALAACFSKFSYLNIFFLVLAFVISWWIYVPVHELLHAFGCFITGGEVTELAISKNYGAALLKQYFPFVKVGSDYAGQLTGFNTHGNDLIYLAADFFPFLLTIFIGVPILKSTFKSKPLKASIKLGISLPIAFAPFISIIGDYYEMGSILVSRIFSLFNSAFALDRIRSDDVFKIVDELLIKGQNADGLDYFGITFSFILGVLLAFLTYLLGSLFSKIFEKIFP